MLHRSQRSAEAEELDPASNTGTKDKIVTTTKLSLNLYTAANSQHHSGSGIR